MMEKKRSKGTKIFGSLIILYSLVWFFMLGIGPGGASKFLGLLVVCSAIGGVGVIIGKKWSWHVSLVCMIAFIVTVLSGLATYYKWDVVYFLRDSGFLLIIPCAVIFYLTRPKVKEQFK